MIRPVDVNTIHHFNMQELVLSRGLSYTDTLSQLWLIMVRMDSLVSEDLVLRAETLHNHILEYGWGQAYFDLTLVGILAKDLFNSVRDELHTLQINERLNNITGLQQ